MKRRSLLKTLAAVAVAPLAPLTKATAAPIPRTYLLACYSPGSPFVGWQVPPQLPEGRHVWRLVRDVSGRPFVWEPIEWDDQRAGDSILMVDSDGTQRTLDCRYECLSDPDVEDPLGRIETSGVEHFGPQG